MSAPNLAPATTNSNGVNPARQRAARSDRHRTDEALRTAVTEEMLSLDEYDERCRAVWSAVFVDELDALTADIVAATAKPPEGSWWSCKGQQIPALAMNALLWANDHRRTAIVLVVLALSALGIMVGCGHMLFEGHHEHLHHVGVDDGER